MRSQISMMIFAAAAVILSGNTEEPLAVQIQNVIQAQSKSQEELTAKSASASTAEERAKIEFSRLPEQDQCTHQLFVLAKENPKDPAAESALIWILHNARYGAPDFVAAVDLFRKRYSTSAKIGAACPRLMSYSGSKPIAMLMRSVIKNNPSIANQGMATYTLAKVIQDQDPKTAERLLHRTIKEYGSSGTKEQNQTLEQIAKDSLFEINHLRIGSPAPELSGKDADGNSLSLSANRGKVVLVSFFGSWCGPCRSLFPHERALVEKFPTDQFTLLGVAADPADKLKEMVSAKDVTWPCISDQGGTGPIATNWHVHGWPTLYVIDRNGIIRYKPNLNTAAQIDAQVHSLIARSKRNRA